MGKKVLLVGGAAVVAALSEIISTAPASDPSEGGWDTAEDAFKAGREAAHFELAQKVREALPGVRALLQANESVLRSFPEFKSPDEPLNGGDAVDTLGQLFPRLLRAVHAADPGSKALHGFEAQIREALQTLGPVTA